MKDDPTIFGGFAVMQQNFVSAFVRCMCSLSHPKKINNQFQDEFFYNTEKHRPF
jgi:hypothetical protein